MPTTTENKLFANPYNALADTECHAFWQILVERDSKAFAAADWSLCNGDFAHDRFEGISAHGSLNPIDWTLRYPTLESYRDDWLEMAKKFQAIPLSGVSHLELLYRMQRFAKVDISSNRAVVWKQFAADEALTNGERYQLSAQSVYRLHRLDGRWKVVGFVGYLPLEGDPA